MAKKKKKSPSASASSPSEKALRAATIARLKADQRYELALARVRREQMSQSAKRAAAPKAKVKLRILAEGDSWFRYDCGIGVITQLQSKLGGKADITNIAAGGETMKKMLTMPAKAEFKKYLLAGGKKPWDAILFSGGGNDFCGKQFHTWLLPYSGQTKPEDAIDRSTWEPKLQEIAALYVDLAELVDSTVPGRPVYVNQYDFAIPNNKGAGPVGPWLAPGFKSRGYPADLSFRKAVVKLLLEEFAAMQKSVATAHANLQVVETQGTLSDKEWHNELHPDNKGFKKIAAKFADRLLES